MSTFIIDIQSLFGNIPSQVETGVAGELILSGELCYYASDSMWYKASSTNSTTCSTELRIATTNIVPNDLGTFMLYGEIILTSPIIVVGDKYYVGEILGTITNTPSTNPLHYQRYIGTGKSTGSLLFNPDANYIGIDGKSIDNISIFDENPIFIEPQVNSIQFDLTPSLTIEEGMLQWNVDEGTLDLGMPNNVTQQIGQETFFHIKNQTGSILTNGKPIMFAGTLGASGRLLGQYAIADGSLKSSYIMGVITHDIVDGGEGYVTNFGKVRGIDTTGTPYGEVWNDGDILYVSPTIPGALTNIKPSAPNLQIEISAIINAHANGTLFIRPTWEGKIIDANDVNGTTPLNNYTLLYNTANNYWDPQPITASVITDFDTEVSNNIDVTANSAHRIITSGNPHSVTLEEARLEGNSLSGQIDMNSNKIINLSIPTDLTDAANKDYVDSKIQGLDWQKSILSFYDPTVSLPVTPSTGDRYVSTATVNGWTTNYIYEYNGSTWDETIPNDGYAIWAEDEDKVYTFNGTSWVTFGSTVTHNNLSGLQGGTTSEYYHLTSSEYTALNPLGKFIDGTDPLDAVYLSGNVGIGTTTPKSILEISSVNPVINFHASNGAVDSKYFYFQNAGSTFDISTANDAYNSFETLFRIKRTGEVGIGTTSPLAKLDIKTASGGFLRGLRIGPHTITNNDGAYIEFTTSSTDGYGPQIGGYRIPGGSGAGDLIIKTGLNAQTEKFRITDGGNIGINTTIPNSTLHIEGSVSKSYISKIATYTATSDDYTINCTANTFTVTLPTAVGITGRIYNIKNSGTGVITIDADGTETIDGSLTAIIATQYNSITIQSTGTNWIII